MIKQLWFTKNIRLPGKWGLETYTEIRPDWIAEEGQHGIRITHANGTLLYPWSIIELVEYAEAPAKAVKK